MILWVYHGQEEFTRFFFHLHPIALSLSLLACKQACVTLVSTRPGRISSQENFIPLQLEHLHIAQYKGQSSLQQSALTEDRTTMANNLLDSIWHNSSSIFIQCCHSQWWPVLSGLSSALIWLVLSLKKELFIHLHCWMFYSDWSEGVDFSCLFLNCFYNIADGKAEAGKDFIAIIMWTISGLVSFLHKCFNWVYLVTFLCFMRNSFCILA